MSEKLVIDEKLIKTMQSTMVLLSQENQVLKDSQDVIMGEFKEIVSQIGKIQTALEELPNGGSTNVNSDGSGGGSIEMNEEMLTVTIKKIFLEDKDLGEVFEKIISNNVNFLHNKDKIDAVAVDRNLKDKKKKSSKITKSLLIFGSVALVAALGVGSYFVLNMDAQKSTILNKSDKFYNSSTNESFNFPSNTKISIIREDKFKGYFNYNGVEYYIKKDKVDN